MVCKWLSFAGYYLSIAVTTYVLIPAHGPLPQWPVVDTPAGANVAKIGVLAYEVSQPPRHLHWQSNMTLSFRSNVVTS